MYGLIPNTIEYKTVVKEFEHEVFTNANLSHPNVIQLIGVVYDELQNTPKWMIQELGDTSLEKELQLNNLLHFNEANNNINVLKLKLEILRDILRGISFMHHNNIVHRDLKPANIIKVNNTYKLADLGLARVCQNYLNTVVGTPLYVAPEVIEDKGYTLKCDIYSFGVMMIELILNEPPSLINRSSQLNNAIQIVEKIFSSLPPGVVNDNLSTEKIKGFITSLISVDYNIRPCALDALDFIELMLSRFRGKEVGIKGNMQFIRSFSLPFQPFYVAVDNNSHQPQLIIISDYDNHKIYIYSLPSNTFNNEYSDCVLVRSFGSFGTGIMQFNCPMGVAVHEEDQYIGCEGDILNIIIADCYNHRIQICNQKAEFIRSFGSQGNGLLQFNCPYGVALHSTSKPQLIITDCGNNRIQIWSLEGDFIRSFGSKGSGNMQFNCPTGVTVHPINGHIIISDNGNHRIQICSMKGEFIRSFGCEGSSNMQFNHPRGVALLYHTYRDDVHIIISDYGNNRIQIWSIEGEFIRSFGCEGSDNMQFSLPEGVATILRRNYNNEYDSHHIIIADYENTRLQIIGESK